MLIRRIDELLCKAIFEWTPTHNQIAIINKFFQIFEKKHMSNNVKIIIGNKLEDPSAQAVVQERLNAIKKEPVTLNIPLECSLKFTFSSINNCIDILKKETNEHEIIIMSMIYVYFTKYMALCKETGRKVGYKEQFIYSV